MIEELTTVDEAASWMMCPKICWLLKHSNTCPVSRAAYHEFERYVKGHEAEKAALVTVQKSRDVSNWFVEHTGIRHQSPQVLLFKGGQVVWYASHGDITVDAMDRAATRAGGGVG